jgi:CheY-like chemotaxis protein
MMSTIIIIEDNPDSAKLARKLLIAAGYDVHTADDGETGYDLALDKTPDLVLVDLGLPDIDGQTVVALLRQHKHLEKTPIIAFTAYPAATAREMAEAYGCDGVITKPLDTRTFAKQVHDFLEGTAAPPEPEP